MAPLGWHVPSDDEWTTFINCLGGISVAGLKMKAADFHWLGQNYSVDINRSRFEALPAGVRYGYDHKTNSLLDVSAEFGYIGSNTSFWSATEIDEYYVLAYDIFSGRPNLDRAPSYKELGFSVRLVKD